MDLRYSLALLLLGVTVVALLLSAVTALLPGAPQFAVSVGGLSLCTLAVASLAAVMGRSLAQTFQFAAFFYLWGLVCLALAAAFD